MRHHPEHLNTPRLVANDQQQAVWKWDQQEPFGANACNPDPDGDNLEFEFNLRFPGQYFDRETNQHYNYFRDYDPAAGRYVQSDPIGLEGGLNSYEYALGRPIQLADMRGLFPGLGRERPEGRTERDRPEAPRPNAARGEGRSQEERWTCYQVCVPRENDRLTKRVALACAAISVAATYGGFQGGGPAGAYAGFAAGMGLTAGMAAANMAEVDRRCRVECELYK